MEIIESIQTFRNLADRTFRGGFLGYQDKLEPGVDVADAEKSFRGPLDNQALCSNHVCYGPIAAELVHPSELT